MDLIVQVLTVCNNEEGKIPRHFALDLASEKHHGVGFSAALGVPENAQLAFQLFSVADGFHQVVYTVVLMVLGDDLHRLIFKNNEVFYVVNQAGFIK